jgi:hypothetical protein
MMNRVANIPQFLLLFLLFLLVSAEPAHAYLDPGSGSYAAQVVIGIVAGFLVLLRTTKGTLIASIKGLLGRQRKGREKG